MGDRRGEPPPKHLSELAAEAERSRRSILDVAREESDRVTAHLRSCWNLQRLLHLCQLRERADSGWGCRHLRIKIPPRWQSGRCVSPATWMHCLFASNAGVAPGLLFHACLVDESADLRQPCEFYVTEDDVVLDLNAERPPFEGQTVRFPHRCTAVASWAIGWEIPVQREALPMGDAKAFGQQKFETPSCRRKIKAV